MGLDIIIQDYRMAAGVCQCKARNARLASAHPSLFCPTLSHHHYHSFFPIVLLLAPALCRCCQPASLSAAG